MTTLAVTNNSVKSAPAKTLEMSTTKPSGPDRKTSTPDSPASDVSRISLYRSSCSSTTFVLSSGMIAEAVVPSSDTSAGIANSMSVWSANTSATFSSIVVSSASLSSDALENTRKMEVPAESGNSATIRATSADSDAVGAPASGAVSSLFVAERRNMTPARAVAKTIAMSAGQKRYVLFKNMRSLRVSLATLSVTTYSQRTENPRSIGLRTVPVRRC